MMKRLVTIVIAPTGDDDGEQRIFEASVKIDVNASPGLVADRVDSLRRAAMTHLDGLREGA